MNSVLYFLAVFLNNILVICTFTVVGSKKNFIVGTKKDFLKRKKMARTSRKPVVSVLVFMCNGMQANEVISLYHSIHIPVVFTVNHAASSFTRVL